MELFRPHTLSFGTPGTPGGQDEDGFPTEGTPGVEVEYPCRFHVGGSKVFKNQDSTEVVQIGKVRLDAVEYLPSVGQTITVSEGDYIHFSGVVRAVSKGETTSHLEV